MLMRILVLSAVTLALAAVLAGCSSTPSQAKTAANSATPVGCVSSTGTRLATAPDACSGPGRTYSQDDINRTGQQTVGQALRNLNPALTVTGQ
jgi:hypothetical protein